MKIESKTFLPVEIVFNANWWNSHYGIEYGKDFFFDPDVRVESERKMSQALFDRFGDIGLGEENAQPRPIIGPVHMACGFLLPAMWGCGVIYSTNNTPQVVPQTLTVEDIAHLEELDIESIPIFQEYVAMVDELERRFGYVEGDQNWASLQNLAMDLMGQTIFEAYYDDPDAVARMYEVFAKTAIRFVNYIRNRTGSSSITVNRSVGKVDPRINLQSNCSVQMISNAHYEKFILAAEKIQSEALQPYGIHHCGTNMHEVAEGYSKTGACFYDVGWGADIEICRKAIPDAFFNIRLSPVKIRECTPQEIEDDLTMLFENAGALENLGICCINMESDTPDENIRKIFEVAEKFRRYGA